MKVAQAEGPPRDPDRSGRQRGNKKVNPSHELSRLVDKAKKRKTAIATRAAEPREREQEEAVGHPRDPDLSGRQIRQP
jgi:hypothetical protein